MHANVQRNFAKATLFKQTVCSAISAISAIADAQCCFALASTICPLPPGVIETAEVVINSWKVWPGAIFLTQRPSGRVSVLLTYADIGSPAIHAVLTYGRFARLPRYLPQHYRQLEQNFLTFVSALCLLNGSKNPQIMQSIRSATVFGSLAWNA